MSLNPGDGSGAGGASGFSVVSWGDGNDGERWGMWLDDGTGQLRLVAHAGTHEGGGDLSDQQWHHVAIGTPDNGSTDNAVLYVNGQAVAHSGSSRALNTSGANNVKLGTTFNAGANFFDGTIDDAAIWNRLVTGKEIAAIHGLGRIEGLSLDNAFVDTLIAQFDAMGSATAPGGNAWQYAAGLTGGGDQGAINNTGGIGSYIVLDASGNGMQIVPEPSTVLLATLCMFGLAFIARQRVK